MGLRSKVKGFFGSGDGGADDIAEEEGWGDDVEEFGDEDDEEGLGDDAGDFGETDQEWDSAYDFVDDHVTQAGFTDMVDFIEHCMYEEIDRSPMFRDRVQSGVRTVNQVGDLSDSLESMRGGNEMDLENRAEQVKAANDLIDQMDKLEGEEDQIVREAMGIARQYADVFEERLANRQQQGSDASVRSEEVNEKL